MKSDLFIKFGGEEEGLMMPAKMESNFIGRASYYTVMKDYKGNHLDQ